MCTRPGRHLEEAPLHCVAMPPGSSSPLLKVPTTPSSPSSRDSADKAVFDHHMLVLAMASERRWLAKFTDVWSRTGYTEKVAQGFGIREGADRNDRVLRVL